MKEQLIKFETAKLANEVGFDIECENFISIYNNKSESVYGYIGEVFEYQREVAKKHILYEQPTQSLLQKWLRKEHNIIVLVGITDHPEGNIFTFEVNKNLCKINFEFNENFYKKIMKKPWRKDCK